MFLSSLQTKKALSVTAALLTFNVTAANAQVQECVGIDSDLQRLKCFDQAFDGGAGSNLNPKDAMKVLAELVSYDDDTESLMFDYASADPCIVRSIYKYKFGRQGYLFISNVDFSTVERVGDWLPNRYTDALTLQLYYEREAFGSWILYKGASESGPASLMTGQGMTELDKYQGRDATFYIMAQEYTPDASTIMAAVKDAVEACRS